jgi:probable selenium-dependent hydroxylase accessory protein YqeC
MDLLQALELSCFNKSVVSLAGGGGKTSAMRRLASEFKQSGGKVLVTTTTAIYIPERVTYDKLYLWNSIGLKNISLLKPEPGTVTVLGSRTTEKGKLEGVPKEWVDALHTSEIFDAVLVEADGAKRRPVKAPEKYEPVIPECTTLYIGVVGLDCIGKTVDSQWVHRPLLFAEAVGKKLGDVIDTEDIVRLVLSPNGLFKNCPVSADRVLLLNKAESSEQIAAAKRIGENVLYRNASIKRVLIGCVQEDDPIQLGLEGKC